MSAAPGTSPTAPSGRLARLWRRLTRAAVCLVVAWHLFFFAVRNPLDLWYEPISKWLKKRGWWQRWGGSFQRVDRFTWKYGNFVGCEQRFVMFSPPMARRVVFLAVRYEFADGSREVLLSDNEPDPTYFFRFGGYQTRKLERYLQSPPDELDRSAEWPLWEGYARHALRRWRQRHPDDPRRLRRLVLVQRAIALPRPGKPLGAFDPPTETDLVAFGPDGRLWR
jgi:hypothetical protein